MNWAANPAWDRIFAEFGPEGPRLNWERGFDDLYATYAERDAEFSQRVRDAQSFLQPEPVDGVYVITSMAAA